MASDLARLRRRILDLIEKTKDAKNLPPAAWWVGDIAGERQIRDAMQSGRMHWAAAHRDASSALQALEAGDLELAQALTTAATDFYVAVLEMRVRPSDMEVLKRAPGRRGKKAKI